MERQLRKITLLLEKAADYIIRIYIFLILAVLPFYFTSGYSRIGTDKAMFFRSVSRRTGAVLLPLAAVLLILKAVCVIRKRYGSLESDSPKRRETADGRRGNQRAVSAAGISGRFSAADVFMAFYGVSVCVSWLLSDYKEDSLYGAGGWYMGFFTQTAFVLAYFFISRLWRPGRGMFYLILPVSGAVFLLGYLDRFGVHLLEMENRTETFISTVGNINWYCGYAVSVFFIGVALLWRGAFSEKWKKLLLAAYTVLGFATLTTQGSESGVVALGVVLLALFCMSAGDAGRMLAFWQIMTLFSGACLVNCVFQRTVKTENTVAAAGMTKLFTSWSFAAFVTALSVALLLCVWRSGKNGKYPQRLFRALAWALVLCSVGAVLLTLLLAAVNTVHPGSIGPLSESSFFTFSRKWGSNRGATWEAAWRCFWEQSLPHKLAGVGPDAMSAYLYRDGSEALRAMLTECFGTAILTNAHNEWLNELVNLGILGLLGFAGAMLSAMARFFKKGRRNPLLCAVGFCLLACTVNNMFSFRQTLNGATMFVLLGMGAALDRDGESAGTSDCSGH